MKTRLLRPDSSVSLPVLDNEKKEARSLWCSSKRGEYSKTAPSSIKFYRMVPGGVARLGDVQ